MKPLIPLLSALILNGLLTGCKPAGEARPSLTLYVAASLSEVIEELGTEFAEAQEVELIYNTAGSGALARQIQLSPKADIFLSASEAWMDRLEAQDRLLSGTRRTFLSNQLVVIANLESSFQMDVPADLCELPFRHLSIGDPQFVPAGRYAAEWLTATNCASGGRIWDAVAERIAPATDVRAALSLVVHQRDSIGIVYRSDLAALPDRLRPIYTLKPAESPDIRYAAAAIRGTADPELSRRFLDYLDSAEAKAVFKKYGFPAGNQPW